MRRYRLPKGAGVLLLAATLLSTACGGAPEAGAVGGAGAAPREEAEEEARDAIAVQVGPVRREPLSAFYSTSATLRAEKTATITARTRGVIRQLLVEEGGRVGEGDPVAMLEDDEQRIEAARARTTRDTKVREYERALRLHEQQLLSDEAFEAIRREAEDAEHAAGLAELALARTVVRAPFAGTILRRHLDVGATVSDGTEVYDLADLDPLYADVSVPERHVDRLAPGQKVLLTQDAGGRPVQARIERIAPAVDAATGTVRVTLAATGSSRLRPGTFVRVQIVTDTHEDALVVERTALVAEGRRWHVFRLDASGGKVEKVEIGLGYEDADRVEVLGPDGDPAPTGLAEGDSVVVVGASALSDGADVKVISPDEDASTGETASLARRTDRDSA